MTITWSRAARSASICLLFALCCRPAAAGAADQNWAGFRGSYARGVADGHTLVERWNVEKRENILWRSAIPGLGHSSPVIWGDTVFLTSAISGKQDVALKVGLYGDIDSVKDDSVHRFELHALDKHSGKLRWRRTVYEGVPKIERHTKASHANCTPATDGKYVAAFFGSEGLYVYDFDGNLKWSKNFGTLEAGYYEVPGNQWGFASSPVIHDGRVIVLADVKHDSFLAAFDVASGRELWRTARQDLPTWGTPTVHLDGTRAQIVVNGFKQLAGYGLDDGKELWRMHGTGDIPTPTPYVAGDLIFVTQAHGGGSPIYAIRTSAVGDITLKGDETANAHIAWSDPRGGSYMPTSIVYDGLIYILRDNGVLRCRDAKTGQLFYEQRVGSGNGGFTASLVAGDGKLFISGETGEIYVVKAGKAFALLATNELDEICMATPAISAGTLFVRTRDHLVAIGKQAPVAE